jgi:hypothetical protein
LVAYDEDPQAVPALLARQDCFGSRVGPQGVMIAAYLPPALRAFERATGNGVSLSTGSGAVVFLHELRSAKGVRRLAVVQRGFEDTQPIYAPFELRPTLIEPAGWTTAPAVVPPTANRMGSIDIITRIMPPAHVRFYAGQPDPADPAHFTIRYAIDVAAATPGESDYGRMPQPAVAPVARASGTIDGRLTDDGSAIKFSIRDGPAVPPSPWGMPLLPDP